MSADSAAISFQPTHCTLNQRCSTSISWDDGKEVRIYHLGPGNVLQESAYSENNGRKIWHHGGYLHNLKIVLDPTSSLAAVRYQDGNIRVYYQDPNDDFIRALYYHQLGNTKKWSKVGVREKAVKGSSIAVVCWDDANGLVHFSIFYQDPELRLREYLYDPSTYSYVFGDFNPGIQPRGTPISAEVVRGGNVDITVMWRDADGRAASSSWSKSSGWDLPNRPNVGSQILDGSASLDDSLPGSIGSAGHLVFGNFNAGVQLRGTPKYTEVVRRDAVEPNVKLRDAHGHALPRWSKLSDWNVPNHPNDGSQLLDEPASLSGNLPNFNGSKNHPLTMVSWGNGKEIRIYHLDSKRTLQEYAYSEKKKKNCWYYGDLSELNIVLAPDSVIAVIQLNEEIRLYYRDKDSGIIKEARKPPLTDSWVKGAALPQAAASSKIAVIGWTNNGNQIRVYYQDPNLRLQERCYGNAHWTKGAFNPGPQPCGTPIVAEVANIGYPAIQVSWKNSNGRFVSSRCDKHSRWDPPTAEKGDSNGPDPSQLDGSG